MEPQGGLAMWKRAILVCLACIAGALVLGTMSPWPFLQNAAADFIGGLVVGLVVFALADTALALSERREKERHAVQMAFTMLALEMSDNWHELGRKVQALRSGSFATGDPAFWETDRLKAENWELLAKGPLVEHLAPDLFMAIGESYRLSPGFVNKLGKDGRDLGAAKAQAWKDFGMEHLREAEIVMGSVRSAQEQLKVAHDTARGTKPIGSCQ
jgi:hypothetical protein